MLEQALNKIDTGLEVFKKTLKEYAPNHFLSDEDIKKQQQRKVFDKNNTAATAGNKIDQQAEQFRERSVQRGLQNQQLLQSLADKSGIAPKGNLDKVLEMVPDISAPSYTISDQERYYRTKYARTELARLDNSEQGFLDFFNRNKMIDEYPTLLSAKDAAEMAKKEGVDLKWDKPVTEGEVRFAIERNKVRQRLQNELATINENQSFTAMQNIVLWGSTVAGSMPASELALTVGLSYFMPELAIAAVGRLGIAGVDIQKATRVALAAKKAQDASRKYENSMRLVEGYLKTPGMARQARTTIKEAKIAFREATSSILEGSGFSAEEAASAGRNIKTSQKVIKSILDAPSGFTDSQRTAYNLVQLFRGGEQLGEAAQFGMGSKMLTSAADNVITSIPFMASSYLNSERNKTESYSYTDILAESLFAAVIGGAIPPVGKGLGMIWDKAWSAGRDAVSDIAKNIDTIKTNANIKKVYTGISDEAVEKSGTELREGLDKMKNEPPKKIQHTVQQLKDAPVSSSEAQLICEYIAGCVTNHTTPKLEYLPLKTPILTQLKSSMRKFIEQGSSEEFNSLSSDVVSALDMTNKKGNVTSTFSARFKGETGILGRLEVLGLDQLEANDTLVNIYRYNLFGDESAGDLVRKRLQNYGDAAATVRELAHLTRDNAVSANFIKDQLLNAYGIARYGEKWKAIQAKQRVASNQTILSGEAQPAFVLTAEEEAIQDSLKTKIEKDLGKLEFKDTEAQIEKLNKLADDLEDIGSQNGLLLDSGNILEQQYTDVRDMIEDIVNPTRGKGLLSDLSSLAEISTEEFKNKALAIEEKRSMTVSAQSKLDTTIEKLQNETIDGSEEGSSFYKEITDAIAKSDLARKSASGKAEIVEGFTYHQNQVTKINDFLTQRFGELRNTIVDSIRQNNTIYKSLAAIIHDTDFAYKAKQILWGSKSPMRDILKANILEPLEKELGITYTDKQIADSLDNIMNNITTSDWEKLFKDLSEESGDSRWSDVFSTDKKRASVDVRYEQAREVGEHTLELKGRKQEVEKTLNTPLTAQEKRVLTKELNKHIPSKRLDLMKENKKVFNKYLNARKAVQNKTMSIVQFQQEMTDLFTRELRDTGDENLFDAFNDTMLSDSNRLKQRLDETTAEAEQELKGLNKDIATSEYQQKASAKLLENTMIRAQKETAIIDSLVNPILQSIEHDLLSKQYLSIQFMDKQLQTAAEMIKNPNYANEVLISLYTMTPYRIEGSGTNIEAVSKNFSQYIEQVFDKLKQHTKGTTTTDKLLSGATDLYQYAMMPSNQDSIREALLWLDNYGDVASAKKAGAALNDADFIIAQTVKDQEAKLLERNRTVGSNKTVIGSRENPAKVRDYAYRIEDKDVKETATLSEDLREIASELRANKLSQEPKGAFSRRPKKGESSDNKADVIETMASHLDRLNFGGAYKSRLGHFSFINHDLDKMFPQNGIPKQSMNMIRDILLNRDWKKLTDMSVDDLNEAAKTIDKTMNLLMGTEKRSGWVSHVLVGSSKIVDAVNGTYSRYIEDAQTRIHYKDIPTAVKAQRMFGYDSLAEQMQHDFGNLQKEYAILSKVGYDPIGFAETAMDIHRAYVVNKADRGEFLTAKAKDAATISDGQRLFILNCAKLATGLDDTPASNAARLAKVLGNFATSPLLVNAGIKSLTDYSYAHSWMVQNGLMTCSDISKWTSGVDMARRMFTENPELKRVCYYNTALTKSKFLDYVTNGDASSRARGLASDAPLMKKVENWSSNWADMFINKIGHVEDITNINRSAAALNIMRSIASDDINMSYDALLKKYGPKRGKRLQELLSRHDINADDWEFLRTNCTKELSEHLKEIGGDYSGTIDPGFKMFFPEAVSTIADKKIEKELMHRGYKEVTDKDISDFRQIQLEKAMTLIQSSADEMITLPTVRTSAALSLGHSAKSGMGTIINALFKFKSFGVASNQIHFGRRIAEYIDTSDPNCNVTILGKLLGLDGFNFNMYRDLLGLTAWLATSEFIINNIAAPLTGNTEGFVDQKGNINVGKFWDPIQGAIGGMGVPFDVVLGFLDVGGTRGGGISVQAAPMISATMKPLRTIYRAATTGEDFGNAVKQTLAATVSAGASFLGINKAAFLAPIYNEIIGNWIEKETMGADRYYRQVNRARRKGKQVDWWGQRMGQDRDPFFGVFE